MRHGFAAISAAVLLCTTAPLGHAQAASRPISRATLPNDIGIELLGKAAIYSFSYQRMLVPAIGVEAGVGALGGGSASDNAVIVFVPVSAKLYLIPRDGSVYLTGGVVFVTGSADSGPFDESATDFYGQAGLGFEFRSGGGFLIRGTAYTLFAEGEFFIWPGLTAGYAF